MLLSNVLTGASCKRIKFHDKELSEIGHGVFMRKWIRRLLSSTLGQRKIDRSVRLVFTSLSSFILHECTSTQNPPTLWLSLFLSLIKMHINCLVWTRWRNRSTSIVLYAIGEVNGSSLTCSLTKDTFNDCYELIFKPVICQCCLHWSGAC